MSSDPKRLLDGEGSELERLLLASALSARPSPWVRFRAALRFFLALFAATTLVKAGLAAVAKIPVAVLRWTGIGLGTSALVFTGARLLERRDVIPVTISTSTSPPSAPQAKLPEPPATVPDPGVPPTSAPESAPPAAAQSTPSATPRARPQESLARELELLDRASRALSAGRAKQALAALELHRRSIPRKVMAEEALRLRIEATLAIGDAAGARQLGREFSLRYPNSPYAQRLRSLLD